MLSQRAVEFYIPFSSSPERLLNDFQWVLNAVNIFLCFHAVSTKAKTWMQNQRFFFFFPASLFNIGGSCDTNMISQSLLVSEVCTLHAITLLVCLQEGKNHAALSNQSKPTLSPSGQMAILLTFQNMAELFPPHMCSSGLVRGVGCSLGFQEHGSPI